MTLREAIAEAIAGADDDYARADLALAALDAYLPDVVEFLGGSRLRDASLARILIAADTPLYAFDRAQGRSPRRA